MKIVLDLDGTLCRTNTFRQWTLSTFLRRNAVNQSSYLRSVSTFCELYLLRVVGILSHQQMKSRFIARFTAMVKAMRCTKTAEQYLHDFAATMIAGHANLQVLSRLHKLRAPGSDVAGCDVALATAAPAFYARYIAQSLQCECFASGTDLEQLVAAPAAGWEENLGAAKLRSLHDWLAGSEFALFTDHQDDWPLIERSSMVFLVNPCTELLQRVVAANKSYEVL